MRVFRKRLFAFAIGIALGLAGAALSHAHAYAHEHMHPPAHTHAHCLAERLAQKAAQLRTMTMTTTGARASAMAGNQPFRIPLSKYQGAETVLVLSDGLSDRRSLGREIAEAYPGAKVTRTDINYAGVREEKNLTSMWMDNLKPFPFRDNEFDVVILRDGLCACDVAKVCAGPCPVGVEIEAFFSRVARSLNKKNPQAFSYLHGGYGIDEKILSQWRAMGERVGKYYGVRFEFPMDENHLLEAVVITPIVNRPPAVQKPR